MVYRVPIYSISSWTSIMSQGAALIVDPIRDIYEVSRVPSPLLHTEADAL